LTGKQRLDAARTELIDACDGFLAREAIAMSLTADERREILRGMILTRAVDNRLKQFFTGSEVRYKDAPFQGKGSDRSGRRRSMPPAIRLRRGPAYHDGKAAGKATSSARSSATSARRWRCGPSARPVRMILNAQMGKDGPPMNGRDLHIGDFDGASCRRPRRSRSAR
jgi:hypothetical protein